MNEEYKENVHAEFSIEEERLAFPIRREFGDDVNGDK
jgi:hypothetical protein